MRITMLLADAAQAVDGKLYVLGGGWSFIGPQPTPMAIAMLIEVPWDQSNQRHQVELVLQDEDGQPVVIDDKPVTIHGEFEVGRPPGLPPGTALGVPLAINIGPLPLQAGAGYVWCCSIDGQGKDDWRVAFRTRPAHRP